MSQLLSAHIPFVSAALFHHHHHLLLLLQQAAPPFVTIFTLVLQLKLPPRDTHFPLVPAAKRSHRELWIAMQRHVRYRLKSARKGGAGAPDENKVGLHPLKFPGCVVKSTILRWRVMLHEAGYTHWHVSVTCTVLSLSVNRGPISCSVRMAGHEHATAGAGVMPHLQLRARSVDKLVPIAMWLQRRQL